MAGSQKAGGEMLQLYHIKMPSFFQDVIPIFDMKFLRHDKE